MGNEQYQFELQKGLSLTELQRRVSLRNCLWRIFHKIQTNTIIFLSIIVIVSWQKPIQSDGDYNLQCCRSSFSMSNLIGRGGVYFHDSPLSYLQD